VETSRSRAVAFRATYPGEGMNHSRRSRSGKANDRASHNLPTFEPYWVRRFLLRGGAISVSPAGLIPMSRWNTIFHHRYKCCFC